MAICNVKESRGSILVSVLAVQVFLLTIFVFALTYVLARYGFHQSEQNRTLARHLSHAGVSRYLSNLRPESYFDERDVVLAPNGGEFALRTTAWGPYLLVMSDGSYANQTVRTSALIGSTPPTYFDGAVTVCDVNYPFVVAGNTRIRGTVNTGPLGINPGRIKGEGVIDENYLIGGNEIHAALAVPELDTVVVSQYLASTQKRRLQAGTVLSGSVVLDEKSKSLLAENSVLTIENNLAISDLSYSSPSEITSIFVDGFIEIDGETRIDGLVEIVASGPIRVKGTSVLDNVILYSEDSILIGGKTAFSGIAISSSKIIVDDLATLTHPSLLLVLKEDQECKDGCGIQLRSRGKLESICYLASREPSDMRTDYLLYLDTLSRFTGFLIAQGKADLRGGVNGSVVVNRFQYWLPPTTYVNWVKDFHIKRAALDFSPALPVLTGAGESGNYRIFRLDGEI